ncbi:SDR family oxidoreductase [bacterium]|nr:MAG: SDR family oxidoreductase [bacterium]
MNILLSGANGYIGRRLLTTLVEKGHRVYCAVRDPARLHIPHSIRDKVEVVVCDMTVRETFDNLPQWIDAAYYLVHSMAQSDGHFGDLEKVCAENFANWVRTSHARQIIYLGGIANDPSLSHHLSSRVGVESILRSSGVPLTVLRAAIIIGSGSASFEIIRDLVEKLPIMITPKWLRSRCQPIAIRDVVRYLNSVLHHPLAYDKVFDIGGPDILSYKEMLMQFAKVRGYRRYIITIPVLTPRLSSYWLYFVTATSFPLAKALVDSMKNEVVCAVGNITELDATPCISFDESIRRAFTRIEQNEVISSWTDALSNSRFEPEFKEYIQIPEFGCLSDERVISVANVLQAVENIWQIGGKRGWYYMNFLWVIRGMIDKIFGGVGLRRGRRHPSEIQTGDTLDFWRVILADKVSRRLLLYAEMKLPGEAWLEFRFEGETLIQKATFRPRGLLGRLYWYGIYPLHVMVFRGMLKRIVTYRP